MILVIFKLSCQRVWVYNEQVLSMNFKQKAISKYVLSIQQTFPEAPTATDFLRGYKLDCTGVGIKR